MIEFVVPAITIRTGLLDQMLSQQFGLPFANRPPEERNTDAVLIKVGEISGGMGVKLNPGGNALLRKKLDDLLG